MNAIELLIKDHASVRSSLSDIDKLSYDQETRRKLFDSLCKNILLHEKMEHTIWYPYFKDNQKLDKTVRHLIAEEKHAENAIKRFDEVESHQKWEELFQDFKKEVEMHAAEEEENLFPKIKAILSDEELDQIGKEMRAFKIKAIANDKFKS